MSENVKKLRTKFRRKLSRYVGMEMSHCGHEGPAEKAAQERERLIDWLFEEVERCEKEAVGESVRNGGPE